MADSRMVHALALEIPSRRLLERHSRMQTGFAAGNNGGEVYPAVFRGGGGFNGVGDLGGNAHLGGPHGHNVFVVPGVTSDSDDSDTENEDIDSEISTESGGSDAESDLSILSIHPIHSEGCEENKIDSSFPGSRGKESQEVDATNSTEGKNHGDVDSQTVGQIWGRAACQIRTHGCLQTEGAEPKDLCR